MTEQESLDLLRREMDKQGMTNNELRAGTAAIAMGESALNPHTETGYAHTSNDRIRQVFTRISGLDDSELSALKARDEDFFEAVYGGAWGARNLGNTEPGDGFKFRGRTVLQLTGRSNYQALKGMTGYDIVSDPDLANQPQVSAAIAVAYMRWRYKGGGWEMMKRAVGNNTPDIDAAKNDFYERFTSSGEMDYKPTMPLGYLRVQATGTVLPLAPDAANDVDEVATFRAAVVRIQTFLKSKGTYDGQIDGDFGKESRDALRNYVNQK